MLPVVRIPSDGSKNTRVEWRQIPDDNDEGCRWMAMDGFNGWLDVDDDDGGGGGGSH